MTGTEQGIAPSISAAYVSLALLIGMNLLNYIDRYILASLLKPIGSDLHLSETELGCLPSVFLIVYTAFSPVVGLLGDRMPRRYLLAVGVGVWSLATFATGLVTSFWQLAAVRGLLGIGEATYIILAPTLIADLFRRERRNLALTAFYTAIPIGAALGYVLGARVGAWQGWRAAFYIVGLPGLLAALAALLLHEPHRGATEDVSEKDQLRQEQLPLSWSIYGTLLRNRSFLLNTLAMAMSAFALGALQYWTPIFLEKHRGYEPTEAGDLLGVVVAVSGLAGTLLGGVLGDRLARRYRGAYFWVSGLSTLAAVPFILAALLSPHRVVIAGGILVGLTLAVMNYGPSNTILVNVTMPRIRAAALAINLFSIHWLGDIPSPVAIGAVSDSTGGNLLLGLAITLPALAASGLFYCLGAPHLESDQEAMLREMRSSER
jgi:MFS family permease